MKIYTNQINRINPSCDNRIHNSSFVPVERIPLARDNSFSCVNVNPTPLLKEAIGI